MDRRDFIKSLLATAATVTLAAKHNFLQPTTAFSVPLGGWGDGADSRTVVVGVFARSDVPFKISGVSIAGRPCSPLFKAEPSAGGEYGEFWKISGSDLGDVSGQFDRLVDRLRVEAYVAEPANP